MTWRPPLEGGAAERAAAAARDIAVELAAWPGELPVGLSAGAAGIALTLAYADQAFPGEGLDAAVERWLDRVLEIAAIGELGPQLYGGFCGVAWVLDHLGGADDDDDPQPDVVEAALLEVLEKPSWGGHFDLISGLAGQAIWALELPERAIRRRILAALVDRLEELAEPAAGGLTWHTPTRLVPPHQREALPDGFYNLGLSHGVPGIVAACAAIAAAGVERDRAARLAAGGVRWILAQAIEGEDARYAAWLAPGEVPTLPTRSAWCYGDPGVAVALAVAGRCLEQPDWIAAAADLARGAARRDVQRSGVVDPGLCHGAAGLAHVLARLAAVTGDTAVREAAADWYLRLLDSRRPGRGIAGFETTRTGPHRGGDPDPGFLTGAAGVALALLAACTGDAPDWDRCLGVLWAHPRRRPGG